MSNFSEYVKRQIIEKFLNVYMAVEFNFSTVCPFIFLTKGGGGNIKKTNLNTNVFVLLCHSNHSNQFLFLPPEFFCQFTLKN